MGCCLSYTKKAAGRPTADCSGIDYSAKPELTSLTRPSTAACSSAPSAMMRMVVPPTMPRLRTPSRDFALTRRSSFSTQMEDLYSFAFWMKKVAGRALLDEEGSRTCVQTNLILNGNFFNVHSYSLLLLKIICPCVSTVGDFQAVYCVLIRRLDCLYFILFSRFCTVENCNFGRIL